MTSIGSQAFFGCTGITSITIPNGVSSINNGAFIYCSNLTSITIPNSVTEIAESAFYGGDLSTVVTQIKNPFIIVGKNNGVKSTFSLNTFNNATLYVPVGTMDKYKSTEGWKDFVFIEEGQPENQEPPSGVIAVENADGVTVYYNYINDGKELEVTYKSLGEASYSGVVNIPENVTYEGKTLQVTSINDQAFALCYDLVSVTMPNTIANIGQMAFAGCIGLTSVIIPQSVTSIGEAAFSMCAGLVSITVDAGNSIYDSRNNCNAIIKTATNVLIAGCKNSVIPDGVISIGIGAFYFYTDMTSVTLPRSVTIIGSLAFGKCSGLKDVYCYAESVPTTFDNVFDETPINEVTLHVPQASISAYEAVSPWNGFKEIVALTEQEMGLLRTSVDEHEYSEWYQLNGQKSSIPKRGLNIIRMNNGKIKKVVVK